MSEIRGVIFDLDGVVADSHCLHASTWSAVLAEAGQALPPGRLAQILRAGRTRDEMLRALFPRSSEDERSRWGLRKATLFAAAMDELRPVPGVAEWIRILQAQGIPLAVATSAARQRALDTLQHFSLSSYFRSVIAADDVTAGKPDPQLFRAAAQALALRAADVLVVEDSRAGLLAARAARMRALWYRPEPDGVATSGDLSPEFVLSAFTPEQLRPVNAALAVPVTALETA